MTGKQLGGIDEIVEKLDAETRETIEPLRRIYTDHISDIEAQNEKLRRALYGRRSEKMPTVEQELRRKRPLPELTVDGKPMPEDEEGRALEMRRHARNKSEKKRRSNRETRKELPVEDIEVQVREDQLPEGLSREDFRAMGGEPTVVERKEWVPGRYVCFRYHLEALVSNDGEHVVRAEPPPGVAPGVHYGPALHAHIVVSKCADSQPLHRISRTLGRHNVHMARSTICSIFHRSADKLAPIYEAILNEARSASHIHADETTMPVQKKGGCKKGWIWTCLSPTAIVYRFDVSRGAVAAKALLGDTPELGVDDNGDAKKQKLCADGYSGYNEVAADGRTRCGCWGHARRKVFESKSSAPHAQELLELIGELFKVEHDAADVEELGNAKHLARRKRESAPVVAKIYAWVDAYSGADPPSHPLATALTYLVNQREPLEQFLDDPKVRVDNNIAERALRIVALGRKNFLFAGHDEGAQNLAVLQTIVATCMLHRVNPEAYITDLLVRIDDNAPVDPLLPWNWTQAA